MSQRVPHLRTLATVFFSLLFAAAPHSAAAATNIFYSVGQNTTDHKTGSPTVTISGTTATFSTAQTAVNMGVGDKVTFGNTGVVYITGKTSSTVWSVSTATGGTPTATSSAPVNSIAHAYASLNAAVGTGVAGNATSTNFLNTSDLVSGDYILNIPLYFDTATDTTAVTIAGFTTGPSNYIKIYTPTSTTTEVNQSQRHDGSWNETRHKMHRIFSSVLTIRVNYIRLEGLQLFFQPNGSHRTIDISSISGPAHIQISKSIFRAQSPVNSFNRSGYIYITTSPQAQVDIFNNIFDRMTGLWNVNTGAIVYDSTVTTQTTFAFNNTFVSNYVGILHYASPPGAAGIVARNNLFYNTSYDVIGTFGTTTDYNSTSSSTLAYTVTGGGNTHDRVGQSYVFADFGAANYRLTDSDTGAKDHGVDLSGHASLPFSDDIIGTSRPQGAAWNIGAFEYTEPALPPVLSNGAPVGVIAGGSTETEISVDTNMNATCRYSTTSGVDYDDMVNTFSTTGGTSHATDVSGLEDDEEYVYYVRCEGAGVENTSDYEITLWVNKATYYVDESGSPACDDSFSGTELKPWCTIQQAADTMLSGDTVIVKAGSYTEKVTTGANGTASRPITYQAVSTTTVSVGAFTVDNTYHVIDGFTITGDSASANEGSVYVASTGSNTTISDNEFSGSLVSVQQVLTSDASNVTISGNRFLNGKHHAISLVGGSDHLVTQNYITSDIGGDALRIQSSDTVISRNTIRDWSSPYLSEGDSLIVGKSYYFVSVSGSPDFSNAGAGAGPYQTGESFAWTATATTPNDWGDAVVQGSNHPDLIQTFAYEDDEFSQDVIVERNLFIGGDNTQIGNIEDQTGLGNVARWTWRNNIFSGVDFIMSIYAPEFYFFNNVFYRSGTNSSHPILFRSAGDRHPFTTANVNTTANTITASTAIDFVTGDSLRFYNSPPAPLSTSGSFYARVTSGSTFTVHPTANDANNNTNTIDLTTTGSDVLPMGVSKSGAKGIANDGKVFNNIFMENGSDTASAERGWYAAVEGVTGFEADNNLVIGAGAGTTKTGFQTGGLETNGVNGEDPLFADADGEDFTLLVGSPAINAGDDLSAYFSNDFASTSRPQGVAWDIGAYEFSSATTPTVTTSAASSIGQTSATLNGEITATGGSNATIRGFAYGTSASLATTIATTSSSGSFSTGAFTGSASSLTCGTTYYARAYATNTAGTGYGSIVSFATSACSSGGDNEEEDEEVVPTPPPGGSALRRAANLRAQQASSGVIASASPVSVPTLRSFIEALISAGVIPAEKAEAARLILSAPPSSAPQYNLQFRDEGAEVLALQNILADKGYLLATPNGYFGPATYAALKAYQAANGVPATGYYGPLTRASMMQGR